MGFRTSFNHADAQDFCSQIGLLAEDLERELNHLENAWQDLESTWCDPQCAEFAPEIENLIADYKTSLNDLSESHYVVLGTKLFAKEKSGALGTFLKQALAAMEILPVVTGVGSAILANQYTTSLTDMRSQPETEQIKKEPKTCDQLDNSHELVEKANENHKELGDWADQKRKKSEDDADNDAFEASKTDDTIGGVPPSE
ncbi:hypothetical protein [Leptothoe spongobia]|uniref:Uncharacterized protein n=1 Tax=Leptothoe spongobia TAU-MAC 1115 TaxID=1967444 RepID=A0A947DHM2_9CYAN|nr:hypothetical protein [Leptothoe spongobia]MBT9317057.1 hypothetical protein [Leptothoe spongobia TAU-MAC 1115]